VRGDFEQMRQLVVEYDALAGDQQELRRRHGKTPVLAILIRVYSYLIAKYDFDGFRIDTVKYVAPSAVQTFGNAVREFALSIGKKNFFTFGEIADNETVIAGFVGRNSPQDEGFGIDAALDFPLAGALGSAVKGWGGVEQVKRVFLDRKNAQAELLSSHGEAGRFFVSFLDNHDRNERFNHPSAPRDQLTLGLGLLFTLPGIPCLYYGTEQGLLGTIDANGLPVLDSFESVREALWGKEQAFDAGHEFYAKIRELADRREQEPALRYGRYYAREVSGNGHDFGHSSGVGGVIAFSRILVDREVLVVANTSTANAFSGLVVVDMDLNQQDSSMTVCFSNLDEPPDATVRVIPDAHFFAEGQPARWGPTASVPVDLKPMEIQILIPQ
jgi:glycosidase